MRIIVETEREAWSVNAYPGSTAIVVRVKVDGQEELSLAQQLYEAEMQSHFDILWDYLGEKIKDSIVNKEAKEVSL